MIFEINKDIIEKYILTYQRDVIDEVFSLPDSADIPVWNGRHSDDSAIEQEKWMFPARFILPEK